MRGKLNWLGAPLSSIRHVVASETDRASSGITVTVFPSELRGAAIDLTSSGGIRDRVVSIGIGGIEGNIERVTTLMNAELKHAPSVRKFFVTDSPSNFAGPDVRIIPIVVSAMTADLQSQLCIDKLPLFIQTGWSFKSDEISWLKYSFRAVRGARA
jgi:hypothetical protein